MNILVTSGSLNAPLVIMESLARQGHHVYLLDSDSYCVGFHSKYCKMGIVTPAENEEIRYVEAIVKIVQSKKYDFLIPTSDLSTEILSAHRERILPYVGMLLPPKELIELARFKDRTYRFALEKGIAIPQTYFPQSLNDVRQLAQKSIFPCVAKKSRGTANKGNAYFNDKQSLVNYYEHLIPDDGWPVIQEFIPGDLYGFLAVTHQGELLDCFLYKTEQKYIAGGTPPYCYSIVDKEFLNTAQQIVKLLNWTGAINIDFIKGQDSQWRLLEINPRLSGTLPFAYKLGVDLPNIYLSLATGLSGKNFQGIHYKPNVRFRFILAEIIFAFKHKKHWWKFITNCLDFRIKNDISWNDPILLAWELRHLRWFLQDIKKI